MWVAVEETIDEAKAQKESLEKLVKEVSHISDRLSKIEANIHLKWFERDADDFDDDKDYNDELEKNKVKKTKEGLKRITLNEKFSCETKDLYEILKDESNWKGCEWWD